ncbi:glycosyltransferase [Patescibacteria group bacterium]|nr:glycosyltransferase [Patescibacteria group bacterium]
MSRGDTTIAIVAYNAKNHIKPLFESIKKQTVKPREVLVVVDFPEDNTIPIAKMYGFRTIVSDKPKIYGCRNTALRECKSKIISFTDSDCVIVDDFVENVERVFREVSTAAITGPHPRVNPKKNIWNWIHENRFRVQAKKTGYTDGVIGANSSFSVTLLKMVGGWPDIPNIMAAEDVAISNRLQENHFKVWFDESVVVNHHYKSSLGALVKQEIVMGSDIMTMMLHEGRRGYLFWYSIGIPLFFGMAVYLALTDWLSLALLLGASFAYMCIVSGGIRKAFPQWVARIICLPFYSYGILKGLIRI